ncbi:hypothetical protein C0Q70_07056 [Pomacea canaliculata]|uniref:DUF7043 domain-containing protein n=1 Tax=Pomacea canaliculata TaxID=400727 RepID=A0A2T7PDZ7_POMCA|nr:hypothetical protein C0Q70_07056 [Pomacea canaliculata]
MLRNITAPLVGLTSALLTVLMVSSEVPFSRAPSSSAVEPRCHFPDFLQSRKGKTNWMINQSNSRTSFDVVGGRILARSGTCSRSGTKMRHRQPAGPECTQSNYTWVCLEQQAEAKYLVQHLESTFVMYACVEFLQRNLSVVQIKMSHVKGERFLQSLCDEEYMFIDPWPWISYEHFRSPPVACPITGGFNLLLKYASPTGRHRPTSSRYYSSAYMSPLTSSSSSASDPYVCIDASTAPMRLESDCVKGDGVFFDFRHELCLPPGSKLMVQQRALCMASWRQDHEDFAVLRSANNDRAIWCLRVTWKNDKVHEIVLFLDWVCPTSSYTESARRYSSQHSPAGPHLTPHLAFEVRDRQVITEPCSDQLSTCHSHAGFCSGLQCMWTCGKCSPASTDTGDQSRVNPSEESSSLAKTKKATIVLTSSKETVRFPQQLNLQDPDYHSQGTRSDFNQDDDEDSGTNADDEDEAVEADVTAQAASTRTSQRGCTFPENVRGTWLHRTPEGEETLEIGASSLRHPRLGELQCVTFLSPHSELVSLRRVLWRRYDNGCYPRFTCIHFSTPSKSVMRYRLANEQHWPLELADDAICDERNFLEPPDIFHPGDKYVSRSWEVARRSGPVQNMPCILPHHVPRVVSFLDDQDRSGCMVHGTYYSPRTIVLAYFPTPERGRDSTATSPPGPGLGETPVESGRVTTLATGIRKTPFKNDHSGDAGPDFKETHVKSDHSNADGSDFKEGSFKSDHSRTDGFYFERNVPQDRTTSVSSTIPEESHFDHDYRNLAVGQDDDEQDLLNASRDTQVAGMPPDVADRKSNRQDEGQKGDGYNWKSPSGETKGSSGKAGGYSRETVDSNGGKPVWVDDGGGTFVFTKYEYSYSGRDKGSGGRYHLQPGSKKYKTNPASSPRPGRRTRAAGAEVKRDSTFSRSDNGDRQDGGTHSQHARRDRRQAGADDVVQTSYECLAVMTYADTYKSVLTVTSDKPQEILCWLVVNQYTVVILNTSACNSQTAERVLNPARYPTYRQHKHAVLRLYSGEKDCDTLRPADRVWPEPVKYQDQNVKSDASPVAVTCFTAVTCLLLSLSVTRGFLLPQL